MRIELILRVVVVAVSLLLAAALVNFLVNWTPGTTSGTQKYVNAPSTQPTNHGAPYVPGARPNKAALIIQQNPQCWIGVPGATCADSNIRTYAGE